MKPSTAIAVVLLWASGGAAAVEDGNVTAFEARSEEGLQPLSGAGAPIRRKRHIVFPAGSSLQLVLEVLVHVPARLQVVVGPTLQVAWPLPSEGDGDVEVGAKRSSGKKWRILSDAVTLLNLFGMTVGLAWQLPDDPAIYQQEFKKKHKVYKRNVLKKAEAFISGPGGANGRQCVLKALCESGQRTPSKKDFLTEILHRIFSVEAEEDSEENHEDEVYRKAHRSANQNCDALYPECHFSLFDAGRQTTNDKRQTTSKASTVIDKMASSPS